MSRLTTRVSVLSAIAFAVVLSTAAPASAQIGQILNGVNAISVPVVSTGTDAVFTGTFALQRFVATLNGGDRMAWLPRHPISLNFQLPANLYVGRAFTVHTRTRSALRDF